MLQTELCELLVELSGCFWLLLIRYTGSLILEVENLRLGVNRECLYLTTLECETVLQIAHLEIERPRFG